jgi:hypothetical protein
MYNRENEESRDSIANCERGKKLLEVKDECRVSVGTCRQKRGGWNNFKNLKYIAYVQSAVRL